MEEDRKVDRTWLCSVVFLDIVKYSTQSVETQIEWKTFFNHCLADALRAVPQDDRVTLDTGDGAVVCFLGDPEAALVTSLSLLNSFIAKKSTYENPPQLRLGINLGPIRLIRDINGNLNAVGDGINVGQRIMAFADANQLLISRSYFDVISCLTEQYKNMFRFDGMRQDKHVREHAVYALVSSTKGSFAGVEVSAAPEYVQVIASSPAGVFSPETLGAIERCLSSAVGPMAGRLVTKSAAQANGVANLCELLAKRSVPPREQDKFIADCRKALGDQFLDDTAGSPFMPAEAAPSSASAPVNWDATLLEKVRIQLSEYLGPIAKVLVSRAASKAQTQEELYSLLALNFKSEAERVSFLAKSRTR